MKIKAWLVAALILFGLLAAMPALARKKLPTRSKSATKTTSGLPQSSLVLRGDKLALLVQLTNLTEASSVAYTLTYNSNAVPQGVQGSLDPMLGSSQKELVFGTCSGAVCTYHTDITDMRFELVVGLKSGKTLTRKYQVKI
jgi:hypothetical protein